MAGKKVKDLDAFLHKIIDALHVSEPEKANLHAELSGDDGSEKQAEADAAESANLRARLAELDAKNPPAETPETPADGEEETANA